MSDILKYFPVRKTPRPIQSQVLQAIERNWNEADVFVVSLPTGAGKSAIALTISAWVNGTTVGGVGCHVVTPTNQLVDQYLEDYPHMTVLRSRASRTCNTWGRPLSGIGKLCSYNLRCDGCNMYRTDQYNARMSKLLINNYYTYIMHKLYRPILIADEAHKLLDMLRDYQAINVWERAGNPIPADLDSAEKLVTWVSAQKYGDRNWKTLTFELRNHLAGRPKYYIRVGEEYNRGKRMKCIKLVPISLDGMPARMWPTPPVRKVVLLSATIGRKDIEHLGLSKRRVVMIEGESPIHISRRPVIFNSKLAVNMGGGHVDANWESGFIPGIREICHNHMNERGVIHLTYSLARRLRDSELPSELRSRLIFHDNEDKMKVYGQFISPSSKSDSILVASGMYEGIDLSYDMARFQIVGKIPFPNLGDEVTMYLSKSDPEWYMWQTMKTVIQACGRTTRAEDDYSATYIMDSTFSQLTSERWKMLLPRWFRDSIHAGEIPDDASRGKE